MGAPGVGRTRPAPVSGRTGPPDAGGGGGAHGLLLA